MPSPQGHTGSSPQGQTGSSPQGQTAPSPQDRHAASTGELTLSFPQGQNKSNTQGITTGQQDDTWESKHKDDLIKDSEDKAKILTTKLAESETKLLKK